MLVHNGDVDGLADAMMEVMADDDYRKMLSENAKAVVDTYSEQAVMARWLRLFEELTRK